MDGSRKYLVLSKETSESVVSLEVNADLISALSRRRPTHNSDRIGMEAKMAIERFYYGLARHGAMLQDDAVSFRVKIGSKSYQTVTWKLGDGSRPRRLP
jgi:hypothetical protein